MGIWLGEGWRVNFACFSVLFLGFGVELKSTGVFELSQLLVYRCWRWLAGLLSSGYRILGSG